jgi:hypothetical protein
VTAKTPVSAVAGPVDVAVTLNGRTQVLAGGFRYDPTAPNTAPVIRSIAAQGRRLRQPPSFADYGETIQVMVVVEDAETAPAQLGYQWLACGGTFIGTGPQVDWTAPIIGTLPSNCTVEVIVTDGPHVIVRSIVVRLHDSRHEIREMALLFLNQFADSTIPAEKVVQNFSNSCKGKVDEEKQIEINRRDYRILSYKYGEPSVTIGFGGVCPFRNRSADACFRMPAGWTSTKLSNGSLETVTGVSHVTAVYRNMEWRLCDSDYGPTTSVAGSTFID